MTSTFSPVTLRATRGPGQPEPPPALDELYRGFEQQLLVPLWTEIGDLMPGSPRSHTCGAGRTCCVSPNAPAGWSGLRTSEGTRTAPIDGDTAVEIDNPTSARCSPTPAGRSAPPPPTAYATH